MKKEVEIDIEIFNKKGFGIGYFDGSKVEVAQAIIGDRVLAELNKKRKGFFKAKLLKLIKPSHMRRAPICQHFDICGGCSFQEMNYQDQINEKERVVLEIFQEYIVKAAVALYPIISADFDFQYRNKMEFSFSQNRKGTKYLGLMIKGAKKFVFNLESCHLCKNWFSIVLNNVRKWWEVSNIDAFNLFDNSGILRNLTIREAFNTSEKMVILTVSHLEEISQEAITAFIEAVKDSIDDKENLSIYIKEQIAIKGQPTRFEETHLYGKKHITEKLNLSVKDTFPTLSFKISPSSFFQPNTLQAEKIYSIAINMVDITKEMVVYDLYCGTGTIGMAFSYFAKKVIGIELNEEACVDAKENLKLNNINNFEIFSGDVGKILSSQNFEKSDIVIVDPPRAGLDELALSNIISLNPKTIIYISCNPLTQKENIDLLVKNNYKLLKLQPIDQFPNTIHIENIALLTR